jgi:RNA polymerase-binding transcription factor DksA
MDTQKFKDRLQAELAVVEAELKTVGEQNPATGDWEGKEQAMETMSPLADSNEAADKLEELATNRAINDNLEIRYNEVKDALARIEAGTYGTCEVCGMEIEEERLEANPAAKTCIAHA